MRVRIDKTEGGEFNISMRRTRREEKAVRPTKGVPQNQLGEAIRKMVDEMRGQKPPGA